MYLAVEKMLLPVVREHKRQDRTQLAGLNVMVVFTTVNATLRALQEAGRLAHSLGAHIQLVVPQVVPYPLSLEAPQVALPFSETHFRVLASDCPVETSVRIYLCRDRSDTLLSVLPPKSIVVIGGHKRWWPTEDERLARTLRKAGHEVLFTETE